MKIRERLKTLEDTAVNAATTTALAGKADKLASDLATLTGTVNALNNIPTATTAEVIAKNTNVRRFTPNMVYQAAAAVLVDQKAITEWSPTVTYGKGNIAMRNKSYFESNVTNNLNKDPATDSSGGWSPFVPGDTSSLFFNRAPTNADVYPAGVKWFDLSFGSDTPLAMISLGNGAWGYLNEIKLTKIRIYGHGTGTTYRSNINGIQFFKSDDTAIQNSHFVWGAVSGFWGITTGVAFASQAVQAGGNTWGWVDIECSSQFDSSITIGKINGNTPYFSMGNIEFWYSNGSKKVFTGGGQPTICACDPPVICRYGDAVSAAQGKQLIGSQLADSLNTEYGRISGSAFVSAFNQLAAPLLERIVALEAKL